MSSHNTTVPYSCAARYASQCYKPLFMVMPVSVVKNMSYVAFASGLGHDTQWACACRQCRTARAWKRPFCMFYRCLRNKWQSEPCECVRVGATDVTKPYKFIGFGNICGPNPTNSYGSDERLCRRHRWHPVTCPDADDSAHIIVMSRLKHPDGGVNPTQRKLKLNARSRLTICTWPPLLSECFISHTRNI